MWVRRRSRSRRARRALWRRRRRRTPRPPSSPQQQQAAEKQIGAVSTDVASVKTDVGGVKTDVATTKSDLETTKAQMQRMMGDEGKMSGLIATNHDELESLKHKGDRNYFEFTLQRGAAPTLLSTIKLQLKKVDVKHSRYTLDVSADDKTSRRRTRTSTSRCSSTPARTRCCSSWW